MSRQLKMYRMSTTPFHDMALPEGYSYSNYRTPADKQAWVECCKQGLIADDATTEAFDSRIVNAAFINVEKDVFFLDYNGEHIGTATAIHHTDDNSGELHMVGIRPDFRGRALGKNVNNAAVKKLINDGVDYIELTTDEWRVGAVKSYLTAGFQPVKYDLGMVSRWEYMLTLLGIDECEMLNDDTSFFCTLHRRNREPSDRVIRLGVLGARTGESIRDYCSNNGNAMLVALCDTPHISDGFDKFIANDIDAVVLADEYACFARRCIENGKDVLSESLPVHSESEAAEFTQFIENSGRTYACAKNGDIDTHTVHQFVERLLGDKNAELVEIHEAIEAFR